MTEENAMMVMMQALARREVRVQFSLPEVSLLQVQMMAMMDPVLQPKAAKACCHSLHHPKP